jgi:formamidopyrimidine-DNA glycosylase
MPELPEVEVLARHLAPLLKRRRILGVSVRRAQVLRPTSEKQFKQTLRGAIFGGLRRRGKYLLFELRSKTGKTVTLLGHLGMTGRMYLSPARTPLPKHAAVVFDLGRENFIFEDTRYFGRLTFDESPVANLGPEPWDKGFTVKKFADALKRSAQPIKVKLLDQSVVAGVGNIYGSEALFHAGISPRIASRQLKLPQIARLRRAVRETLADAIERGSTIQLNFGGGRRDGLFYFGRAPGVSDFYAERLQVYDRAGEPCRTCGTSIKRIVQAARSTFYCQNCQRGRGKTGEERAKSD